MLLDADLPKIVELDSTEPVRGWTPLIVACVEGHFSNARLLIDAGADQRKQDCFGWTAKEHAAFRGYLQIAALLSVPDANELKDPLTGAMNVESLGFLKSIKSDSRERFRTSTKSHILVTLGSPNTRDDVETVNIRPEVNYRAGGAMSTVGCVLEVSAIGAVASSRFGKGVQLPIYEDMINQPWHFIAEDPSQVKLVFCLSRLTDSEDQRRTIGSGIALLQNLQHGLASTREGLARYHTIPILEKETLQYMGTITFGIVVVTPSPPGAAVPTSAKLGFWRKGSTQVVGHRGSGANSTAHTNLQLGENTIQSFISAAALGATAVEFDVQLTKDLIPVIYHDFLVMEAGGDTPLYTLRLDQFLHLSQAQSPKGDLSGMAEKRYVERTEVNGALPSKQRSYSLSTYDTSRSADLMERMRYTEAAMEGAHKGNLRGDSIHGAFPTFQDLFMRLPESIAFNVEMKYPMLWEAEDRNMDRFVSEINAYVDIVLSIVYRLGGSRSITFSSFSPEVCILLRLKQQDYPVLFLSKAGSIPTGDVRCSGLQQSIRLAKRWDLAGE